MSRPALLALVNDDAPHGDGADIRCGALAHAVTQMGGQVFRIRERRAALGCLSQCRACRDTVSGTAPRHPYAPTYCRRALDETRESLRTLKPSAVIVSDLRLAFYAQAVAEYGDTALVLDLPHAERHLLSLITGTQEFRLATRGGRARILSGAGVAGCDTGVVDRVGAVEAALVDSAAAVTTVSPAEAAALTKDYGKAVQVLPTTVGGCDRRPLTACAPDDAKSLLFAAPLDHLPHFIAARELVSSVLPEVQRHLPDIRLTIAGRNPPEELTALCAGNPRIRLLPHPPCAGNLLAHSVLIHYLPFTGGSPLTVLQAFEAGIPVLATRPGATGTAAEPGYHYLDVTAPRDVTHALRVVLDHPADDLQRRTRARTLVRAACSWGAFQRALREMTERYV